jgi:hypothetical protein
VPPNLHGARVTVTVRLDGTHLDIATTPGTTSGRARAVLPTMIARHLIAPAGAGIVVRDHGHVAALDQAAMNAATSQAPHRGKVRRPPTPAARAEADTLRARTGAGIGGHSDIGVVVDLARYAAAATGRNTLHADPHPPSRSEEKPLTEPKESPHRTTTIKEINQP